MKIIFLCLLASATTLPFAQNESRGFEQALQDCKEGVYERTWLYKGCTLHDLEGLADRLSAACSCESYRDRFLSDDCDEPIHLDQFFGSDQQSVREAWRILLPLDRLSSQDVQLLRMVINADEQATSLVSVTPGQLMSALGCFAAFDSYDLFNQTADRYGCEYKQANGLQWFPLMMAQAYGESLWESEPYAGIILGDTVDVAWALPVALARLVCSPTPAGAINHHAIVIGLLDDRIHGRD